jgi:oxygen-independent coproporphyrinogen-3 oxidase
MNRAHTAEEASASVMRAYESGFSNITIDLIYGLPGLAPARWQENLDKAFSLPVNHLSCYCLTVEKKTALDKMVREGKVEVPDEDLAAQHFLQLMDEAEKRGFEHYEISNFAKPGFRSRHNSAYWSDEHYIGIGPSAHWNVASNAAYADAISKGEIPATTETLTLSNRYNEYIMTSLRTMEGIDAEVVSKDFGEEFLSDLLTHAEPWIENGSLIIQNRHLKLTREGKLLADRIAAAFFM